MNIDDIVNNIILPLLQCSFVFLCFFENMPVWIKLTWRFCTIIIITVYLVNEWFKTRGITVWKILNNIEDPVVIISGGSNGLGKSLVLQMLQRYPNVKIINVDITTGSFESSRVIEYKCDFTDKVETKNTIDLIKKEYGRNINLVINNAGIRLPFMDVKQVEESDLEKVFAVHCNAPISFIKNLTPELSNTEQQCYVVTVASILGVLNPCKVSAYAASKAALISLHQSYSFELADKNISHIRTLLVLPGQLNTKMFGGFEPPSQFFAPIVNADQLATKILDSCDQGSRGNLQEPLYTKFAHILMSMPYVIQIFARKFSGIDDCLPTERQ